eukprot:m.36892 g.36892  ORF g.36892 m.36892 type:complete len:126 (+) comp11057_c0_seq2:214-591(+)
MDGGDFPLTDTYTAARTSQIPSPPLFGATQIVESEFEYVWKAELVGLDAEDVQYAVNAPRITVFADFAAKDVENDGMTSRHERVQRSVRKTLKMPGNADPSRVTSVRSGDVFTLVIPKLSDANLA